MRKFLKDKIICGAVGVWSEGDIIRYCLSSLLSYCDYIVVMMDYPDEKTENIVKEYKEKYPEMFRIGYTTAPKLRDPNHLKRRAKVYASQIVEDKLSLVKRIHKEEKPIDILLTPDSDEVFTSNLPNFLTEFWDSGKSAFRTSYIDVYENMNLIHTKGLQPHFRGYRYCEDLSFTPRRYFDCYYPIKMNESFFIDRGMVHLSQLKENWDTRIKLREYPLHIISPNAKIWKTEKNADLLTSEEYNNIISKNPDYILKEYKNG